MNSSIGIEQGLIMKLEHEWKTMMIISSSAHK